jgi:hypothetical protein
VTLCPALAARFAVTLCQAPEFVQVSASSVVEPPVLASVSVALAQSYWTVSGHTTRYQKVSVPPAAGMVKVWEIELSVEGLVLPTSAEAAPECAVVLLDVWPLVLQPVRPLSNPPLVMPPDGGAEPVTVTLPVAVCEPAAALPVTVKLAVAEAALVDAVSVNVALWPAVIDDRLNEPLTPEGNPFTESAMLCARPEVTAVVTETVADPPGESVALDGFSAMEKLLGVRASST